MGETSVPIKCREHRIPKCGICRGRQIERVSLTGRIRGRPRFFGLSLIMQVEEEVESADGFKVAPMPCPPGHDPEAWTYRERQRFAAEWKPAGTRWRDATWQDQLTLAEMNKD